jgi:hypothetical protein
MNAKWKKEEKMLDTDKVKYYNHWTGKLKTVRRNKLARATGVAHDIEEDDSDTKPLPVDIYKTLGKKESEGSMLWLEESHMIENLLSRGNTIDEVVGFYKDVIRNCKRHGIPLTPVFERIAGELNV